MGASGLSSLAKLSQRPMVLSFWVAQRFTAAIQAPNSDGFTHRGLHRITTAPPKQMKLI